MSVPTKAAWFCHQQHSTTLATAMQQKLHTSQQKEEWHDVQWCCTLWLAWQNANEWCGTMHTVTKLCSMTLRTWPKMLWHNAQLFQTPWHNAQNLQSLWHNVQCLQMLWQDAQHPPNTAAQKNDAKCHGMRKTIAKCHGTKENAAKHCGTEEKCCQTLQHKGNAARQWVT